MELAHGIHLAYCTNIHRGEGWGETFDGLKKYTLEVKRRVAAGRRYAIGLRLGHGAAVELSDESTLAEFRNWMDAEDCYVCSINGFPYGRFHGTRVKEKVYLPDWSSPDRLEYTNLLFDLLARIVPEGVEGSVSTLPGSFKEFVEEGDGKVEAIAENLRACAAHIAAVSERCGRRLHLGLEPEPLGLFETSAETAAFFERHLDGRAREWIGVNYDTCHLAVEFEEARQAIGALREAGVFISKLHLSSALRLTPTPDALERLRDFDEEVYLHQVIARSAEGLTRYRDLPDALDFAAENPGAVGDEWRVHFHVPVHAQPEMAFGDTREHIEGVMDMLAEDPAMCRHLELETYTWEVLPAALHSDSVVDQLEKEYHWCLKQLRQRGLA